MRPLGPQREHYWLALSMAKAAGVDIQAAIDAGHFDHQKWARAVHRCRSCEWGRDCPDWLRENPAIDSAPETCVNARIFAALKAAQGKSDDRASAD